NLQNNGNGSGLGGTCSGDSGGPVFDGGYASNTIVAVTSFGLDPYCRGVVFAYRTDQTEVLNWIKDVIGEEEYEKISIVAL
nr:trypsin-like serine protease [Propionibacteriaceae bacterium]